MGLAAILILQLLLIQPDLMNLYSSVGDVDPAISSYLLGNDTLRIVDIQKLGSFIKLSPHQTFVGIFSLYLLALIGLFAGFHARIAAIVSCICHSIIVETSYFSTYGVDRFAQIYLFYLCFCAVPGIPGLKETWEKMKPVPYGGLWLKIMQLHLAFGYTASGWDKAQGSQWWNGEVIWRAINLPGFASFDMTWTAQFPWLLAMLSIGTVILEGSFLVAIWLPYLRWAVVAGIIAMHIGIAVFMQLWIFSLVMIVLNVALFIVPRLSRSPSDRGTS